MAEENRLNRKGFVVWAIGGLISLGMSIPAIAYIIGPALQRDKAQNWLRLGSTSKVELGTPTLFKTKIQRQAGWIVNEEELSVYVRTDNGRDFVAMSNICTHLACRVRWIAERQEFFCPCHNGVYDKDGKVLAGPPPRPLDRYEVKVEDNQLFIQGG
ncbi:MAG TPA: ubiquinol-cytochrome c reductase iron-sulfur subunit [Anaerolineae bacterium]